MLPTAHPRRRLITLLLAALTVMIASTAPATHALSAPPPGDSWDERAERAQQQFREMYWDADAGLFRIRYPESTDDEWHYWWQAHALDTLVDGYERTGDERYLQHADQLYRGVLKRNDGITIDYYDDMEWMALALLRLYDHTENERYRDAVLTLWRDIQGGWNDSQGGGIAWRKEQLDYKNTPANAPAVILAARLYQRFGDEQDLQWAKKIYGWLQETLVDPETGFAWDGINRRGRGRIDRRWAFTYNQGVYLGASLELFRITGDSAYRDEALRTAQAARDRFIADNGIFRERGNGDGGLFKGILVDYLTELIVEFPDQTVEHRQMLLHNAETLWKATAESDRLLFAADWTRTGQPPLDLSVQLSGLKLIEHAARLTK